MELRAALLRLHYSSILTIDLEAPGPPEKMRKGSTGLLSGWVGVAREGWALSRPPDSPAAHGVLVRRTGLVGCIPESLSM